MQRTILYKNTDTFKKKGRTLKVKQREGERETQSSIICSAGHISEFVLQKMLKIKNHIRNHQVLKGARNKRNEKIKGEETKTMVGDKQKT